MHALICYFIYLLPKQHTATQMQKISLKRESKKNYMYNR